MGKGQIWDMKDLNLVLRLFKSHTKQSEINRLLISDRKDRGVWEGEHDLSNRISRLSPNSKHRDKEEKIIRVREGYLNVIRFIMMCRHCAETEASKLYTDRIYTSGIAPHDFILSNNKSMMSIRFETPQECVSQIYFAFTSEDYVQYEDEQEDIWTVKTPYTYMDVLAGRVDLPEIERYLTEMANGKYVPIFLNTVVWVNRRSKDYYGYEE